MDYACVIWDITEEPIVVCTQRYDTDKARNKWYVKLKKEYKHERVLVVKTDIATANGIETYLLVDSDEKTALKTLVNKFSAD